MNGVEGLPCQFAPPCPPCGPPPFVLCYAARFPSTFQRGSSCGARVNPNDAEICGIRQPMNKQAPSGRLKAKRRPFEQIVRDFRHVVFAVIRSRPTNGAFRASALGSGFFVSHPPTFLPVIMWSTVLPLHIKTMTHTACSII